MTTAEIKQMTVEDYHPATIEELSDALDKLVSELVAYRKRQEAMPNDEPWEIVSASVMFQVPQHIHHQRSVVRSPIDWALKRGIKEVGKLMFDVCGKTRPMVQIANDVADRDPRNFGVRISIIDHTFNGIGAGQDVWCS